MALTIHAQMAEKYARAVLREPRGGEFIAEADEWRRTNPGSPIYDAFGQPFSGWTIGQTAMFAKLLLEYDLGHIRATSIPVGDVPARDRMRDENRRSLANLPLGITAEVYDGLSHFGDGHIVLPDDLVITGADDNGDRVELEPEVLGDISLEIGHTDASRTWLHLHESRAVARWPYGHKEIIVLALTAKGVARWFTDRLPGAMEAQSAA